jgi:hypothetical protein
VTGDFGEGDDWFAFEGDGSFAYWPNNDCYIRNATPAEILAHPDVWPDWQGWAQTETFIDRQPVSPASPQPEQPGVMVTITQEQFDTFCDTWQSHEGDAEYTDFRKAFESIGITINPPDAPAKAPWETAYEAWAATLVAGPFSGHDKQVFEAGYLAGKVAGDAP